MSFLNDEDITDVQSIVVGYIRQLFNYKDCLSVMGTGNNDPFSPYILYKVLTDRTQLGWGNYTGYMMLYDEHLEFTIHYRNKEQKEIRIEFADPNSFDKLEQFIKEL